MLIRLILDTDIHSILRTHQQQEVQASRQAVLERVGAIGLCAVAHQSHRHLIGACFASRFRAYSGR